MASSSSFGAPMRAHFLFDPQYRPLNHGSFGTIPRTVQSTLHALHADCESHPDLFIRRTQPSQLPHSRALLSSLLNVPTRDLVLTKNATTAVATVLHNLDFAPGDVIIYFDTVYGAVEKGLVSLVEQRPGLDLQLRKVPYEFPMSHEEIVRRFEEVVRVTTSPIAKGGEGKKVKAAVFDTVVSNPGVRFPFEKLVESCRNHGILSVVDAAHAVGLIKCDLGALKPDFWASNCHKWLYTPRGCAVLYVAPHHQHLMRTTLPTSWGYIPAPDGPSTAPSTMQSTSDGKTPFEALFEFVATADDAPYLCIPAAMKFRQEVCGGEDRIVEYSEELANEGADVVADALGTEVMMEPGVKKEESLLRRCGMTTVRLPIAIGDNHGRGDAMVVEYAEALKLAARIQNELMDHHGTFVPVFPHGGWLWTRLSAQVYLEKSDFEWLGGVLRGICEGIRSEYK